MEETRVNFKAANLAKKKGFNESCNFVFENGNEKYLYGIERRNSTYADVVTIPTQSLLQKWLRETHNIDVDVVRDSEVHYQDETRWIVKISNWNDIRIKDFPIAQLKFPNHLHHVDFKSYEEALEKGLEEGLKFIENEKI